MDVKDLAQLEIFSVLTPSQQEQIALIAEIRHFAKDDPIYSTEDKADRFFVVTRGAVSLRDFSPGDALGMAFQIRERGELLGCGCFMSPRRYTLNALCLSDCEVVTIDADRLFELCEKDPELGYKLMKKIAVIFFERYTIAKKRLYEIVSSVAQMDLVLPLV